MKATVSTVIHANVHRMWAELLKIESLRRVASPILVFKPQSGQTLPSRWEVGGIYALRLDAFSILPLGRHQIHVTKIDPTGLEIYTNESGTLTKTWNHRIRLEPMGDSVLRYTDEIEIRSGVLTPVIWLFAQFFYRHRQKKWKRLLADRGDK